MSGTEHKVALFDGSGDFSLWKTRMYAYLSIYGLKDVLKEKTVAPPLTKEEEENPDLAKKKLQEELAREDRCEKAKMMIYLNVADPVLRKINHSSTAAEAWDTLERLFMVKTLPNRVYLQLKVYNFRMQDSKSVDENIDDFLKLIADLNNLEIEVPDEVQAVLLLSALPAKYEMLKETLKYSREKIKFDEVVSAARSKELDMRDNTGNKSSGEGLFVRGKTESKGNNSGKGKNRGRSKSRDGKKIC